MNTASQVHVVGLYRCSLERLQPAATQDKRASEMMPAGHDHDTTEHPVLYSESPAREWVRELNHAILRTCMRVNFALFDAFDPRRALVNIKPSRYVRYILHMVSYPGVPVSILAARCRLADRVSADRVAAG